MGGRNCLIIWDRIGDYHRARIRAFEKLVGEAFVFTADLGSADRLYKWENSEPDGRHFVLSGRPVDERDMLARCRAFWKILRDRRIKNLAIAGYAHPEYIAFLVLGRLLGCRIVLFAESWYGGATLKNRIKGFFLNRLCDRFFLSGKRASEHFNKHLRIPCNKILCKYSVVHNTHFLPPAGIARERVLLCVARFSPEKNLDVLIKAFQGSRLCQDHRLRVIGGGPERERLQALIDTREHVELLDWVSYSELPGQYARARFFILPSVFEPWGLVVNEAMAAGLPVVVSDACGCAPDLVTGENGFLFSASDEGALIQILDQLADLSEDHWQKMSARSRDIITEFGCRDWAVQLKKGFEGHAHH
jgi:glycosyltransferase involved in cell wall biosynthesis